MDIDMAIAAKFADVIRVHDALVNRGFQIPSSPNERASLFLVTDTVNMVEVEIWTKPDGVVFDEELLRRRVKVRPFDDFEMYAIGPEDFIVNKLARQDRGIQDEQDVVSVLRRMNEKLDRKYVMRRAVKAKVDSLLKALTDKTRRLGGEESAA